MMTISRRQLMIGTMAASAAFALPAAALPRLTLHGDGVHDDTEALRALFRGEDVHTATAGLYQRDGTFLLLAGGVYLLSGEVKINTPVNRIEGARFIRKARHPFLNCGVGTFTNMSRCTFTNVITPAPGRDVGKLTIGENA